MAMLTLLLVTLKVATYNKNNGNCNNKLNDHGNIICNSNDGRTDATIMVMVLVINMKLTMVMQTAPLMVRIAITARMRTMTSRSSIANTSFHQYQHQ